MKRNGVIGYDAYPKTILAQNALYNNMSHHYRRLYGAKPRVDTGLPKSYKLLKQRNINRQSVNGFEQKIPRRPFTKNETFTVDQTSHKHEKKPKDVLDGFKSVPFHPRILKTNVESKVRSLREYHPPRKKVGKCSSAVKEKVVHPALVVKSSSSVSDNGQEHYSDYDYEDDRDWLQPSQPQHDTRSTSKPSSSDSAYTEEGEGMWSGGESRDDSPQQIYPSTWTAQKRYDDDQYITFLRSITDEVLRKGIYTNKALKKVFQEHIQKNIHKLDVKRMQQEVEKLQEDLGIPKDDELNDLDYGLGCGTESSDSVEVNEFIDIIDSVEQLNINSSWSKHDSSVNIKLPLKLPCTDNDNDSSIGCEILTSSSGCQSVNSAKSNLGDR
ncbi:uncharacterized protein LOC142325522 [Lycorma delicatula]|uniref:uncharacterized protein LOC142325522 n=1 Tax=Lycorma delicatula TaxID=130591 RepID=UPI003F517401